MTSPTHRISVYYDGACSICSREAQIWRYLDLWQRLRLIDISSPEFRAADHGLDPASVQRLMHVKTPSGRILVGVDALRAIWRELPGLGMLARLSDLPGVDPFMRIAYRAFSRNRYWFARHCAGATCVRPRAAPHVR